MQMICNECGVWFAMDLSKLTDGTFHCRCPICHSSDVRCSTAIEDMYEKRKEIADAEK
mgnify:CR=1 FL=1